MNQQQLIDALTEKANRTHERSLAKADVKAVLDSLAVIVAEETRHEGDEVSLPGLGKFKGVARAARTGRNPQTGKEIEISAKNTVIFKPSSALLAAIA